MKKITLLIILLTMSFGYAQDPATGPTNPPARNAGDVKSIYNGITTPVAPQYTNEPGVIFDTFGSGVTMTSVTLGDGNTVMKYTNHNYSGIQAGAGDLDVSSMTMLHIDVYSPNFTSFKIKLEAVNGSNKEIEVPFAKTQNSWNSYDIDLSTYVGVDLAHLKWIVPVTNTGVNMYIDNVYFYKPAAGTVATLSDLKVAGTTVAGFSPGKINYSVVLPKGTTTIPQITAVTKTNPSASEVITQASALPGDATVVVTSQDASTTKTYTVSFSVDTSTPCSGFSEEAQQGSFANGGYSYDFKTTVNGADSNLRDVRITFELLVAGASGVTSPEYWKEIPFTPINAGVIKVTDTKYYLDVVGLAQNATISYACKFVWAAGGFGVTKYYSYNVGDTCTLGTDKFEGSSVKMYPNPVKNILNIEANASINKVSVYNILGQEVLTESPKSNSASLQTSDLQRGVYMITTDIDGNISTSKFIKE